MKVKKLIKELQKLKPNQNILTRTRDGELIAYDISHIIQAYENNGRTLVEFEGELSEEDLENCGKEDIRHIALNKPCYLILPD